MTENPSQQINLGPDEQELHRLTIQHEVLKAAYPSLILAPIDISKPGLKILDSATADGLWLREIQPLLAKPHALVGTDVNPNLFPSTSTDGITFQVQDVTKPWPSPLASTFDLVHSRVGLAGCGTFPVSEAVKNLVGLMRPGGWIQIEDMDIAGVQAVGGAVGDFGRLLEGMISKTGALWNFANHLEAWLLEAGLEDVHVKVVEVPYGRAWGDNEEMAKNSVYSFVLGAKALCFGSKMLGVEGFEEVVDSLPERIETELTEVGAKGPMICVWGRKPL